MSFLLPLLILGCAPETFTDDGVKDTPGTLGSFESFERWNEEDIVEDRILVQRRDGIRSNIRFQNLELNLLRDMDLLDIQEVEIPEGVDYRDVLQDMWESGEYTFAEPVLTRSIPDFGIMEFTGDLHRAPNDPYYQFQTNMDIVQATDNADTGSNIIVAVIDTGVATGGSDTPVNMMAGFDFVNNDTDATDDQGHGTHVAGTIAQATNNGIGAIGVAPDVIIMPLKTLDAQGDGFSTDTISALEYALQNGADVVNLSLGASSPSNGEEAAVDALVAAGVAVVAANGNDGLQTNGILYPAAYNNSVAVSATDHQGVITDYSNAGPQTDLAAPGGDMDLTDTNGDGVADQWTDTDGDGQPDGIIQETINGNSYNYYFYEGTSMATPHVAGAFAALMGVGATAAEAESFLKSTAIDLGASGTDILYGHGEIRIQDAIAAYNAAQSGPQGVSTLQAGDLIISEVMHNPEMVVDYRGEWIEIYNNSGAELNLNGLEIDNGIDRGITVDQQLIVADGAYVVLGVYASSIGNGGYSPDFVYNYADLRLGKNTTLTLSNGSTTIDTFAYTASTHDTTPGTSLSLNSLDPSDADDPSNWCTSTSSYGDGDLGTPGNANDVCINSTPLGSLNTGDLIISEVMVDPAAVSDFKGEWFEVYNNSGSVVDIDGLTVGCGGNTGFTVSGTTYVSNGDRALFAVRSNSQTNGGMSNVDVEYSYSDCASYYTDSLSIKFGSTTFDSVSWTSDFPFSSGNSMTLGILNATANDSSGNWCAGSSTYGNGDVGTPGGANDSCPLATPLGSLNTGDLIISEVMVDPAAVSDFRGEWFEIYNNTADTVELNGLTVDCGNNNGFTVDRYIQIESGEEALFSLNANTSTNGGLPTIDGLYAYSDCSFTYNDSMSIGFSSTTFDSVSWTSDFPFSSGSSMSLGVLSASANDSSGNWCVGSSTYGNGDAGTPGSTNDSCPLSTSLSSLSVGDLVISEVMIDPAAVSDFKGEWFEVYNNTADTVELNGLVVGCGNNNGFTVDSYIQIESGEEALFALNANTSTNGGLPTIDGLYAYSDCSFTYNDSMSIGFSSTTFDSVSWTSDFPFSSGSSMSLGTLDATSNDSSINWCEGSSSYGSGDLGTPGDVNDNCPNPALSSSSLGSGDLVISEIMTNPVTVFDFRGEWFEIYNNSGFTVNLNGLKVNSSNNSGFTIDTDLIIAAADHVLFAVNANSAVNGGLPAVDYVYGYSSLSFTRQDDISLSVSSTLIDSVSYTPSYPPGVGASLTLGVLSATANDSVNNWCEGSSAYGSGENGTPGEANDSCP